MRFVLDTKSTLRLLLEPRGRVKAIRARLRKREFIPVVSEATLLRSQRAMEYPGLNLSESQRQALLTDYRTFCEIVANPECRTPASVAVEGKVFWLVTGHYEMAHMKFTGPFFAISLEALGDQLGITLDDYFEGRK